MTLVNFLTSDNNKIYYIIFPVLVTVIVPGFILNENYSDFSGMNGMFALGLLASTAAILTALLFLIDRILAFFNSSICFACIIRFFTYFFMLSGLLAPLSIKSVLVDPSNIPVSWENLLFTASGAILLYIASVSKIKRYFTIGLYTFLGINLVTSLLAFQSLISDEGIQDNSIYSASSERNIFVVSFDGLPREPTIEKLQQKPRIMNNLKDFIIYKNVISSSPLTVPSIFSELNGNHDYKSKYLTRKDIEAVQPLTSMTNYLHLNGYQVSTYGHYTIGFMNDKRAYPENSLSKYNGHDSSVRGLFNHTLVRIGSSYLVRLMNSLVNNHFSFFIEDDPLQDFYKKYDNDSGPSWAKKYILGKFDLDAYIAGLTVSTSKPVAHFLHFTQTHFPVHFNSECEYMGYDRGWYTAHQNKRGVRKELDCAVNMFSYFIDKLHTLGIYDQSLIVLKSDHGKPAGYHDEARLESFRIRGNKLWGYGRYTPFLAIKDFNRQSSHVTYDENAVMLDDLAKTICLNAGIKLYCNDYNGYDLLQKNLTIPKNATSILYIATRDTGHRYEPQQSIRLPREKDFFNNLNRALTDELLTSEVSCYKIIRFKDSKAWNNGFSDKASWVTWRDANASFLKYKPGSCKKNRLVLDVRSDPKSAANKVEFELLINGIIHDYTRETPSLNISDGLFRISVVPHDDTNQNAPLQIELRPAQRHVKARLIFDTMLHQ